MPLLPDSPRKRRRLAWAAALSCLVAAGVSLALLIPGSKQGTGAPSIAEGPAQLGSTQPTVRLTSVDRRAINATLDRFIPAGMERRDLAVAWSLAGPEMKSGSTLADWRSGTSPIPYYATRETTFHDWRTIDVGKRYVVFNLLLHPAPTSKLAPYVFSGQVVKSGGRWLVNRLYTIAIMNPVTKTTHEVGPADFAAPAAAQSPRGKPVLGRIGIVPVLSILALILLIPVTLGAIALLRARRWKRSVRERARTELPPLPSSYGRAPDEPRRKVTRH